ncbi:MAG TPA: DNA double-strand break repair nuclease NurA [Candidatus Nanoarchaeia archaeon]|nr:DNA double-strand break repair nuclease NurA [Candidatus Nanoarchaeia archaeon]
MDLSAFDIPTAEFRLNMPGAQIAETLTFTPITPKAQPLICVDGGSAEIVTTPTFSLQLVRIAAVYSDGSFTRMREEWMLAVKKTPEGYSAILTPHSATAHAFPQKELVLSDSEQVLLDGGFRGNISRLGAIIRRLGELEYARHVAEHYPDAAVVLDGSLQTNNPLVETAMLHLVDAHPTVGVCKTADLFTISGHTATAAMQALAREQRIEGCYSTNALAVLRTARNISVRFARLHPHARYLFRIDAIGDHPELVSALAATSTDPVFFGYPYPLIVADQLARVSHEEQDQRRTELLARNHHRYPSLREAMHAIDAHRVLDRIR